MLHDVMPRHTWRRCVFCLRLLLAPMGVGCHLARSAATMPNWVLSKPERSAGGFGCAPFGPVPSTPTEDVTVRFDARAMGTHVTMLAWAKDTPALQAAFAAALAEIQRLERLMTTWPHSDWEPSDIMRLNAAAGDGRLVPVSPDTFAVLAAGVRMGKLSHGIFDITIGAMRRVWHFDEDLSPNVPLPAHVAEARAKVGFSRLYLDADQQAARLADAGMAVDLGGIAKGYAVDAAVAIMRRSGYHNIVVQAGGDAFVAGRRGTVPWRLGLRDPRGRLVGDVCGAIEVTDAAVSTAGDYERGFDVGARRYHHILDPRTGYPAAASRSATIVAPSALWADALDDVVFVLGPKRGLAWLEQVRDNRIQAMVIDAEGHDTATPGWHNLQLVEDRRPPPLSTAKEAGEL